VACLLRAGHTDYLLNDAAYGYMRKHALSAPLIANLAPQPEMRFTDNISTGSASARWTSRPTPWSPPKALRGAASSVAQVPLRRRRVPLRRRRAERRCRARLAQGSIRQSRMEWQGEGIQRRPARAVLVHAERLVHKLDAFTNRHRAAQTRVRGLIWGPYASLKAYRLKPGPRRAVALRARFDHIFLRRTGFVTLDRLLARLHANKAELLMVLDRPETPLHTNGSENDIRCYVTRRKGQRRDTQRYRPRLLRCFTGSRQDLRQARHRGPGLSGQQAQGGREYRHSAARRVRQGAVPPA
jgi:hypothetical protein